jgi:hypothetical protein
VERARGIWRLWLSNPNTQTQVPAWSLLFQYGHPVRTLNQSCRCFRRRHSKRRVQQASSGVWSAGEFSAHRCGDVPTVRHSGLRIQGCGKCMIDVNYRNSDRASRLAMLAGGINFKRKARKQYNTTTVSVATAVARRGRLSNLPSWESVNRQEWIRFSLSVQPQQ